MLASGTTGPDSIQLTANPTPSGGTYTWTATSGGSNVTILNSTSQTSTIQSVAAGTATIQVTYTLNSQSASATQNIAIQLPWQLGVTSDTGSTQNYSCGGVPYMCGVQRLIQYQVQDASSTAVAASMPIYETFGAVSNTCTDLPNTPTPSSGTTDGGGNFPSADQLAMKSLICLPADGSGVPQGSCDLVVDQSWYANGYRVRHQRIDYACRTITLAPL
jgi:hypothetical protein